MFQRKAKGLELFEKVCDYLNLLERDYFGLKYEDKYDKNNWLQLDRRISKCLNSKLNLKTRVEFRRMFSSRYADGKTDVKAYR